MNKLYLMLILLFGVQITFAQRVNIINSTMSNVYDVELITSSEEEVVVDFSMGSFKMNDVVTPRGNSVVLECDDMMSIVDAGQPAVPSFPVRVMIGDNADMKVKVISSEYMDYENVDLAPSKGDFPRSINPDDVPYTYGEIYDSNAFFPADMVTLNEPYIHRDVRGQNMIVTPFAYNPQTKTLRVYHHIVMSMYKVGDSDENVKSRRSSTVKIDPEMIAVYENRYINYGQSMAKYTVLEEEGDLLVICHDAFMNAMEPFVEWKNSIGRTTTMVSTSVTGTTNDAIKGYITTQYQNNDNLTHVLLVGDDAQIPGKYMSLGSYSGKSDYWYGQIEGSDYYNELFVGRFSAETADQVTTQVNKTITYERDLTASATWLSVGQGVSKNEGLGSGHYGEADYQHIDNIRNDMLDYTYTEVHRDYQGVSGVTSSAAIVSEHINSGVGMINYCNHGSETSWGVFSYNNSHVNALTNDNKLPFVVSVACLNGKYDYYTPCFGETWLRATNNSTGEPTGAIGGMFSYVSQPWQPPQYGQDEITDILVESYSNNIKRTAGGVTLNGNMKILDLYGSNTSGTGTYNTWILFGDPTLMLRTEAPSNMTVSHSNTVSANATSFPVTVSNANGAVATLSRDGVILGTAMVNNGTANITLTPPTATGEATLTVIGFNKVTYIATINVEEGGSQQLSVQVSASPTMIARGNSTTLTASATGGTYNYTYSWTPTTGLTSPSSQTTSASPTQTTTYTCNVSDGSNNVSGTVTVTVVVPPTNLVAQVSGSNVNLSWTAATPCQSYKIYRNNVMLAQNITSTSYIDNNVSAGSYTYTVRTVYNGIESPNSNSASAIIYAPLQVTASATPTVIPLGSSSDLRANATGGNGSYTYSWSPASSLNSSTVQTPVATPESNTTYTVTVTSNGNSVQASVEVEVVVPPTEVTATLENDAVVISWASVAGVDHYALYRDGDLLLNNISTTSYTDNDVSVGTYCYTVKAVYSNVESPDSEEACVTIEDCPAPENLEGEYYWSTEQFGALLYWDKALSENELTEFRIYRSKDGNDYEMIQRLVNVPGLNSYQYFDSSVAIGTYYYKVSAYYNANQCESDFAISESDPNNDYVMINVTYIDENTGMMTIYPNPASSTLNVKVTGMKHYVIYNMVGNVVCAQDVDEDETVIDVSNFESGVYVLQLMTENGIMTRKVNIIK